MNQLKKIAYKIIPVFTIKVDLFGWMTAFLGIIAIRSFTEQFLAVTPLLSPYEVVIEYVHNLFFFLISIIAIWIFLTFFLKTKPQALSGVMLWASLLIILPPFFDIAKTHGEVFWSFYMLSSPQTLLLQFSTIFGHMPSGIVYFGTKIVFLLTILLSATLIFFKTKNFLKTALGALAVYAILFLMGAFPSIFGYLYYSFFEKKPFWSIQGFNIAQIFGVPGKIFGVAFENIKYSFAYKLDLVFYPLLVFLLLCLFFLIDRKKVLSVLSNFRLPQLIYHAGLFFIGMGLGFKNYPQNFSLGIFPLLSVASLLISIALAWMASVIPNDIHDQGIDEITNSTRPLPQKIFTLEEYKQFGILCFLLSVLGGLIIGFPFAVLLVIYQILAFFYSAPPFRLKKFPLVATLVSALASLNILFLGFILLSDNQTIQNLSPRIILLLLLTYTLSIPAKDLKDIAGDKKYEIWTVPVILGEEKGRIFIGVSIFLSYILSVFFLNEFKLFPWALIFASFTFLAITSKKIKPREILWWILGFVTIYLLILIKLVFLG